MPKSKPTARGCASACSTRRRAGSPLIDTFDAARFDGTLDYTTTRGVPQSLPFAATLGHVFNHGTHHRGQITAAITAMGHACPEIDLVWMLQAESAAARTEKAHAMTTTLDIRRPSRFVAEVWLNRPDVRNAFNDGVIAELHAAFTGFAADTDLRAIVLGGHGKAFCAGADLSWMRAMAGYDWEQNRADAQALADMLLDDLALPGAGGRARAGRLLRRRRRPGRGVRRAGRGRGRELLPQRGEARPAARHDQPVRDPRDGRAGVAPLLRHRRALQRGAGRGDGLRARGVRRAEALDAKVDEIVATLVANGPMAARACKRLVQDVAGLPLDAALRAETARRIADIRASDEGREGMQSFLNKRKPAWLANRRHDQPPDRHRGAARDRRRARLGQRPAPVRRACS